MDKKRKIGRNDPCPCGSAKKYKRCCGAALTTHVTDGTETDGFKLNREIAYKGKIGRERKDFCIDYIEWKQTKLGEMQQDAIQKTAARGETITCHKGCYFCCSQPILASLGECEAIVYYLYQNERVLSTFLETYPRWRAEVKKNGDIFKAIEQLLWDSLNSALTSGSPGENYQAFLREEERYFRQNIPCPFLSDGLCLIYDVRPFACARHFSTSPAEWCSPLNANKPNILQYEPDEYAGDSYTLPSFYGPSVNSLIRVTMPVLVYKILQRGFDCLSVFAGSKSLLHEAMNDPEVKAIIGHTGRR